MMGHDNPFDPTTPFFDVWPDYNLPEDKLSPAIPNGYEVSPKVQRQAELYARGHFRDGNVKDSKRHQRKNKKMAKRKARR